VRFAVPFGVGLSLAGCSVIVWTPVFGDAARRLGLPVAL
jgi:hypothetical protein